MRQPGRRWAAIGLILVAWSAAAQQSAVDPWQTLLKPHYFADVELIEDQTVFELVTPYRSEDAAV